MIENSNVLSWQPKTCGIRNIPFSFIPLEILDPILARYPFVVAASCNTTGVDRLPMH